MSIAEITRIKQQGQEGLTKYNAVISSDHAYIHKGLAYTAIINLGSIAAATKIAFKTPSVSSGKFVHWRPAGLQTSADYVSYVLYEGDTYSSGNAVTPINRNRAGFSNSVSKMQDFKSAVTSTPAGTIIQQVGIGTAGTAANRAGGGAAADEELVLKANTDYVILITPAGATTVTLELYWYEEDGYNA